MYINFILDKIQNLLKNIYQQSFILKNIDSIIFVNILLLILCITFMQSDTIGMLAIFINILTFIKILVKPNERFEITLSETFLLIFFLLVIISVSASSLFYLSLKGFFKTFTYLGFYVSLIHYFKDNINKIKYVILAILVSLSFETIIAMLQNFANVSEISGWQDTSRLNPEEIMTRVYGTLKPYNPNLFGGYLLAIIPTTLVLPIFNKKFSILSSIFAILSILALIYTACRGAYIGLFFQILSLLVIVYLKISNQIKKKFLAFISLISIPIITFLLSTTAIRARILSIFAMRSDSSNSFRFNVYNSCLNMLKDNWLLGIGVGNQNFREIYGLYMKTGFDALSAYNIYLELAVESGIFALISFLSFVFINLINSIKYILKNNLENSLLVLIALLSIIGILFHGFVDTVFFRPQIQFIFWIMIAIIRILCKK